MKLGDRLAAAAALSRGENVIDIGSDHGFLPVWMLVNGKCVRAAACDIHRMPLERCIATAEKHGVAGKMEFFLSDGLDSVPGTYDTAFVCGMGGIMIKSIISRAQGRVSRWVAQPMTNAELLRAYFWGAGYTIAAESYAVEGGKPYALLAAEYTGAKQKYSYADTYLGKARPQSAEYARYVQKVLSSARKRVAGKISQNADHTDDSLLAEECLRLLAR